MQPPTQQQTALIKPVENRRRSLLRDKHPSYPQIAQEATKRGWSLQDLARKAGLSKSLLSSLVLGKCPLTQRARLKIAEAFDKDSSELFLINLSKRGV